MSVARAVNPKNRQPAVAPVSSELVLSELRLQTRAEHDRLERILQLEEPMTLARYTAIVAGFDAFLRAWEPRVQAALPPRLQPWFRARRRGGFATADLHWLRDVAGKTAPAPDTSAVERLPLDALPQVLGSVYVIEGSALGSRVIAPRLKATLDLVPGRGASYFHGFGGATGEMWRDFRVLAALEVGESPAAIARACRSARRTFAVLIDLFAPLAREPDLRLPVELDREPEVIDVFTAAPGDPGPDTIIDVLGPTEVSGELIDVTHDEQDTVRIARADLQIDLPADLPAAAGPDTVIDVLGSGEPADTMFDVLAEPREEGPVDAPPHADAPDTVIDVLGSGEPPDTMFDVLAEPREPGPVDAPPRDGDLDTIIDVLGSGEPPDTVIDVLTLHPMVDERRAPRR
ncbi:MAG: biliverdin-producing heme oxygenase [Burkholderiaceae bacterium]